MQRNDPVIVGVRIRECLKPRHCLFGLQVIVKEVIAVDRELDVLSATVGDDDAIDLLAVLFAVTTLKESRCRETPAERLLHAIR